MHVKNADFYLATFTELAQFDDTHFVGKANFGRATFLGECNFQRAAFHGLTSFRAATFRERAVFQRTHFDAHANFRGAVFQDTASFDHARFHESVNFERNVFQRVAGFQSVTFFHAARFSGSRFQRAADFRSVAFHQTAAFSNATFESLAGFARADFRNEAFFRSATFLGRTELGPMTAVGPLDLTSASFSQPAAIELDARRIVGTRVRFTAGGYLRVARAGMDFEGAEFPETFLIAATPGLKRPRLYSLERANVTGLVISDVALQACRFAGAHNLDRLRIEGPHSFPQTPKGLKLGRLGGQGLPIWFWTRRLTIAEEYEWRATRYPKNPSGRPHPKRAGWRHQESQPPRWSRGPGIASSHALISSYRALRKGLEDNKDEPGAADFYYGEMEMRRLTRATTYPERAVLTLYWLVAGYGLRGLRPLIWLIGLIFVSAWAFPYIGFEATPLPGHDAPPTSFLESLTFTAANCVSFSGPATNPALTVAGDALRLLLRFTGPLLIALALLAIRSRVKR